MSVLASLTASMGRLISSMQYSGLGNTNGMPRSSNWSTETVGIASKTVANRSDLDLSSNVSATQILTSRHRVRATQNRSGSSVTNRVARSAVVHTIVTQFSLPWNESTVSTATVDSASVSYTHLTLPTKA